MDHSGDMDSFIDIEKHCARQGGKDQGIKTNPESQIEHSFEVDWGPDSRLKIIFGSRHKIESRVRGFSEE